MLFFSSIFEKKTTKKKLFEEVFSTTKLNFNWLPSRNPHPLFHHAALVLQSESQNIFFPVHFFYPPSLMRGNLCELTLNASAVEDERKRAERKKKNTVELNLFMWKRSWLCTHFSKYHSSECLLVAVKKSYTSARVRMFLHHKRPWETQILVTVLALSADL